MTPPSALADSATSFVRPADNPFCTRRVRPGALEYRFLPGDSLAQFYDRWRAANFRGAIVGPHGTGKSTFLAAVRRYLSERQVAICSCTLHTGERRLPPSAWQAIREYRTTVSCKQYAGPAAVVIVDGYEQLSLWERWRLRRQVTRGSLGILVTSHTATLWDTLLTTGADRRVIMAIVDELQADFAEPVDSNDVAVAISQHPTNVREALFALYDAFEARKVSRSTTSAECAGDA